jgi:hypothetical protein
MNDHDLLTQLANDVCWIKNALANHLKHHWAVELALLVALIGVVIKAIWK